MKREKYNKPHTTSREGSNLFVDWENDFRLTADFQQFYERVRSLLQKKPYTIGGIIKALKDENRPHWLMDALDSMSDEVNKSFTIPTVYSWSKPRNRTVYTDNIRKGETLKNSGNSTLLPEQ